MYENTKNYNTIELGFPKRVAHPPIRRGARVLGKRSNESTRVAPIYRGYKV